MPIEEFSPNWYAHVDDEGTLLHLFANQYDGTWLVINEAWACLEQDLLNTENSMVPFTKSQCVELDSIMHQHYTHIMKKAEGFLLEAPVVYTAPVDHVNILLGEL